MLKFTKVYIGGEVLQRREKILEVLREQGTVTLRQLQEMFPDYSSMTLRRDLEFFENMGEAERIRGGAKLVVKPNPSEDIYEIREIKNKTAKEYMASLAVPYVETGRSVFLDSGTTCMCLAGMLPDTELYILTSGPNIAVEVSTKFKPTVTLIGGQINRQTLSVSGEQSAAFIKNFNIDVAFIVASAFSVEDGFTSGNAAECELKKAIIAKAKRTIVLADSTKIGKSMPYTFAGLEDISLLITEKEPSPEVLAAAKEKGAEIIWQQNDNN